ncbi:succinylglutamate desuccinylase/aspartoacylase family protein [Candidatus Magnetaquicoccus inordinatus]|uniref:succinylglutamate desuccinylase/aspartoacylase family protein n=1 Tax=Candidatus Magnetaquicoccus inordinatus TaxID=2496818 RepID=UPI00102C2CA9|nr:succinylglutamate desuccinylase/aspartoacylase family protein [Candidatus Magnetaquicoccus inordinatus]
MNNFSIQGQEVPPGGRCRVDMPITLLSNHVPLHLSLHVQHGQRPGPVLFVSAAVHGDEIIGVEIIRRLWQHRLLQLLRGTLLCIPIVNVHGFIAHTRYLPDRRDLNRSFPGSANGSLAARLAHLFVHEVVERSNYGIDIHSATLHRRNLPQIRIAPGEERLRRLAAAFQAPIIIEAPLRAGSLREAARERGVPVLLYEAGAGLRLDEESIRSGMRGILAVMRALEMLPQRRADRQLRSEPVIAQKTQWIRAPMSGLWQPWRRLGDAVECQDLLGILSDPIGDTASEVRATQAGLLIGCAELPVVNQGDALFHVALSPRTAELGTEPLFDEDEIV